MKLIIDCLIYEFKKAPGYESYITNILDHILANRKKLLFKEIIVAVRESQMIYFEKYADKFTIKGFKIKNIFEQIFFQNTFKRSIGLSKNDVILFTYGYTSAWKQCTSIMVVHDLQHLHYPQYFNNARKIQRAILVPISLKKADKIIAISNYTKKDIINNFNVLEDKIEVIYNDCNFEKFSIRDGYKESENLISFINGDKSYFLSVSSLLPHKNIKILIKAFIEIVKENTDYYLILVGGSSKLDTESKELIKKAGIESQIVFTNYVSNYILGLLYKKCAAFILPTQFEGFGMPIVEAQYFNALTILSDIEICREIAGDDGLYFDNKDECKLIEIMEEIIAGNIPERYAREKVIKKFSKSNTSEKYIDLLNKYMN